MALRAGVRPGASPGSHSACLMFQSQLRSCDAWRHSLSTDWITHEPQRITTAREKVREKKEMQLGRQKVCPIVRINQICISRRDKILHLCSSFALKTVLPIRERSNNAAGLLPYKDVLHQVSQSDTQTEGSGGNEFPHSHTPVVSQMQMPYHPKFGLDTQIRGCSPTMKNSYTVVT